MLEKVVEQKAFDRTLEWNEAGWTGKGITVWNIEDMTSHGTKTRKRIFQAAPECNVISGAYNMSFKDGQVTNEYVTYNDNDISGDELIQTQGVSIMSSSLEKGKSNLNGKIQHYNRLKQTYNLSMFNAAGNEGDDGVVPGAIPSAVAIYVGACVAFGGNFDDLRMAYYSSWGDDFEEVDFSTFPGGDNGTSFACPYLAGITALLQQRYGKDITQNEVYTYFKMISKPIDTGNMITDKYDLHSGYGIPILPPVDKKYVRMTIDSKDYKIDGEHYTMDVAPFIIDGRTFVPIAFAALALGAKVEWVSKTKTIIIKKDDTVLMMTIGSRNYTINGKPYVMDAAPFIKNDRTFVPIAFIALALNCKVGWCAEDKKVLIIEQ